MKKYTISAYYSYVNQIHVTLYVLPFLIWPTFCLQPLFYPIN